MLLCGSAAFGRTSCGPRPAMEEFLKEKAKSGTIKVEVKPSAKSSEVLGWLPEKEAFKVSVKAPPEGGKANAELVRFLSKLLGSEVRVVSGHASKRKVLRINP